MSIRETVAAIENLGLGRANRLHATLEAFEHRRWEQRLAEFARSTGAMEERLKEWAAPFAGLMARVEDHKNLFTISEGLLPVHSAHVPQFAIPEIYVPPDIEVIPEVDCSIDDIEETAQPKRTIVRHEVTRKVGFKP